MENLVIIISMTHNLCCFWYFLLTIFLKTVVDCSNGEDEKNCNGRECPSNEYGCSNGRCIPQSWVCDKEPGNT